MSPWMPPICLSVKQTPQGRRCDSMIALLPSTPEDLGWIPSPAKIKINSPPRERAVSLILLVPPGSLA
jgi:hypothetical protein